MLESAPPFIETLVTLFGLVCFEDWIEGDLVLGFLADGFLTKLVIFFAVNFFVLGTASPFTKTLVTLFGLVHFEDWMECDLVLGFLVDNFSTRHTIFLAVNFFVLESAPSFSESIVTLFGLVCFEELIASNLVLGFLVDGFLTKLAIFLAINFFILGSAPPFTETLVTLFGLVHFED